LAGPAAKEIHGKQIFSTVTSQEEMIGDTLSGTHFGLFVRSGSARCAADAELRAIGR
jgi:hypothetical protein